MMSDRTANLIASNGMRRLLMWMVLLAAMMIVYGCGSDSHQTSTGEKYPVGISEDIEQQLKYDARVDGFGPEGEDLIVNVNDSWLQSPPGIRERVLGHWFSLWQPTHGTASKIVVKFDGSEVERWSAEKGYQPASMDKKDASEG
jgi:hypothetical protein